MKGITCLDGGNEGGARRACGVFAEWAEFSAVLLANGGKTDAAGVPVL